MPNLKQRLIKAGTDFNYSEGVKVKATTAIAVNEIVYANGYDGPFITVALASSGATNTSSGRLMIAKHAIPSGEYGVVLPWKLVTGINTNGEAVGAPVWLADAEAGGWTATDPEATNNVIIGSIVKADATTGGILFCTDMGTVG